MITVGYRRGTSHPRIFDDSQPQDQSLSWGFSDVLSLLLYWIPIA